MRLIVVCNARSGSRAWPEEAVQARLEAVGHDPVMVPSTADWRMALDEPADALVAAGGDGTVRELAQALIGSEKRLAIIPLGTANNIARAFGYAPGSDPFLRVEHWGATERTLRIERVRYDDGVHPFLEVAGVGPFARLLRGDAESERRPLPLASLMAARHRLVHGVLQGPVLDAQIALDGRTLEGRFVMVACLRTPSFGPALCLAPDQLADGDEMTIVGVRNDQREPFAWWLATGEGDVSSFRLGAGRIVEVTSDGPFHADDTVVETPKSERRTVRVGCDVESVRLLV
ncbi:MAG: diacylglycerol kinase family protein [Gemmatimonadales bacterium]